MSSTQAIQNLAALGKNHSATVAGQLSGLRYRGSAFGAQAWAKICGAVKSTRIATWFRANPLKGAIIGGGALDASLEAAMYLHASKDLETLQQGIRDLGYGTLLIDLSQLDDYASIDAVLSPLTEAKRSAAFIEAQFSDGQIHDLLAEYMGAVAAYQSNFLFPEDVQAKIDALCILFTGLQINPDATGNKGEVTQEQFDFAMTNALQTSDVTSMDELVGQLASDYSELRTPVRPGSSRILDFQSFVRFRMLQYASDVNLGPVEGLEGVMKAADLSKVLGEDDQATAVYGESEQKGVDLSTLISNAEQAADFYEPEN